jgi:GMP synthase (glutamine-hydrolysing)
MSILVLRHETWEHLGHFAAVLEGACIPFKYHDLGEPYAQENHDALIVLGGPMSANDRELEGELELIGQGLKSGTPMLGVCLGSQLIARALGARVYRNSGLEIGWAPVFPTEAARSDPVFKDIPSPSTFFHWHGETFDLPDGAELLARSERTRHQAFRYGSNVYGLQFHPEVTAEMIADWCRQPVNCGDVATLTEPIHEDTHDQAPLAARLVEGWLSCILVGG